VNGKSPPSLWEGVRGKDSLTSSLTLPLEGEGIKGWVGKPK